MDCRHPNRLRELRRSQGIEVADVAKRIGLHYRQVVNHELGRTPLSGFWIELYARIYGVSTSGIFIAPNGHEVEELEAVAS